MSSIIKIKRSDTSGSVPSGLEVGEIAVNLFDRKIYVGNTAAGVSKIGGEDFKLTTMDQTGSGAYLRLIGDDILSANNILLRGSSGVTISRDANGSIAFSASVDTAQIADGAVTSAKIANKGIQANNIADGIITSAMISAGGITANAIGNDSVALGTKTTGNYVATIADSGSSHITVNNSGTESAAVTLSITNGAIDTAQLAADAVDGTKIADDSIDSEHYVDGSIDTAHIGDLQVTSAKLADGAVTSAKIAAGTIQANNIATGAVDTAQLADEAVTTAKIAEAAVTAIALAAGAVGANAISDGALTGNLFADGAITPSKIANQSLTANVYADNSIALGTKTTGNYVATISGTTNEIEVSGSGSETAAVTIGLPDDVTIGAQLNVGENLVVTGNTQIGGDLTVDGNLTVEGSTTYLSTSTVYTDDGMFKLTANNAGDTLDSGIYAAIYNTGNSSFTYSGYFRDASDNGIFKFYKDVDSEPTGTVDVTDSNYALAQVDAVIDGGTY